MKVKLSQKATDEFAKLIDDMAELHQRRAADEKGALDRTLREIDVLKKAHEADAAEYRAASQARRMRQAVIDHTALLKSLIDAGRIGAIDACRYEARLHRLDALASAAGA